MWTYNSNFGKWSSSGDSISKYSFDLLKQELSATRFYSRVLSGATFLPVNDLDDIYDVIGNWEPRSWYVSGAGSVYTDTAVPGKYAKSIDSGTSYEYYTKFIAEYGLTLKNLFTADRLIKDSIKNYYYVDVATTATLDLNLPIQVLDDVQLKKGHKVLVKDQKTTVALLSDIDPEEYFQGSYTVTQNLGATVTYEYSNEENGVYVYDGTRLIRDSFLDDYSNCVRYSVYVKMGGINENRQYHLRRLNSGYYPTTFNSGDPIAFVEKHNWMLRNRVDYNNLFEINYYDVIKHGTQSYYIEGITYSIPPRAISVGEFGVILNTQNLSGLQGTSNIIANKYKVNLRSITQTTTHYWIAGDESIVLKVRKHDFMVEKVTVDTLSHLTSISFFDDLRGAVVGELNTILITTNGGQKWDRLRIADFAPYTYTKVLFSEQNRLYIGGRNGIFLELFEEVTGWTALKRRIFKELDEDDEYLLVEGINDLYKTKISSWGLSYSFSPSQSTATDKDLILIATNNGNLIVYDTKDATDYDFLYLDFGKSYGDIRNVTRQSGTDNFFFTGDAGLYSFDINSFKYIGIGNSYSNVISGTYASLRTDLYANEIFDYLGEELLLCGNNSLLQSATYSSSAMSFDILDEEFEGRLKSKLLFMDYDIGAKLNWFTDQGEYRLPNSVTFSANDYFRSNMTRNSKSLLDIGFSSLVYGATAPSMMTQSECNWLTYWRDDLKTFEYYTSYPLNEIEVSGFTSSLVLISTSFSYAADTYNGTQDRALNEISIHAGIISNSDSEILSLAPSFAFTGTQSSRYDKLNRSDISEPSTAAAEIAAGSQIKLYLKDYLLILRLPKHTAGSGKYPVSVGDVYRLESATVDANFIVNKIWSTSNSRYVYMYSEFNQSIITELVQSAGTAADPKIKMRNLNSFRNVEELVTNFNLHPVGLAYQMKIYASSSVTNNYMLRIDPRFTNVTSYYNLAGNFHWRDFEYSSGVTTASAKKMEYTGGFLKFGYTPTYNLLDYLESINMFNQGVPTFYASKEYLSLPSYKDIPLGVLSSGNIYIDSNGITQSSTTGNKIMFGTGLKLEWESIMLNTFVDVTIYQPAASATYSTNRLLVMNKYRIDNIEGTEETAYVIEFHKKLNFMLNTTLNGGNIDIRSRRSLLEISDDLQELNNIHKAKLKTSYISNGTLGYKNYQRELNFKIPTDSYAKAFMSDAETVDALTAIIYVDYKHELSMNITKLDVDFNVPISNTVEFNGQLFISCSQKHGLLKGDGVVLDFNGGPDSSQFLNQNYFGFRVVTQVYGEYDFTVELPYGNDVYVGKDSGFVRYVRRDPFLNYQPIDLIDIGADKKGKIAIELSPDNTVLKDGKFKLANVDFNKYRYRLIDAMNIETISVSYPWILEAEISGAVIGQDDNGLVWYKGIWEAGRWFGGTWISGTWKYGDWYAGIWNSQSIKDRQLTVEIDNKSTDETQSTWFTGRWFGGTWNNGTWANGRFYDGDWNGGVWNNGIWNDGTWNGGRFIGGVWVDGKWNAGIFNTDNEPAYWLDGEWSGGDFENGMWYNGSFESKNAISRFGTKAFNSRTATWHGGKWISGRFYSSLGPQGGASETHKYSMWYTGQWMSGDFYGGIAYNMDFKSGTWHSGILEDIQIIGMNENNNSFILNGIFKFNIGDQFYVIDNNAGGELPVVFGSNSDPKIYTVLYTVEDSANKFTEVYVATNISSFSGRISSYRKKSGTLNANIAVNSYATNAIVVSGAKDSAVDVKAKINLSTNNLVIERSVPVAQYKTTAQTFPPGSPVGAITVDSSGYPSFASYQSDLFSQNTIGVRKSNSTGTAIFHWGMKPNGYLGPGGTGVAVGAPMKYALNANMSNFADEYRARQRTVDPISRNEVSTTYISSGTTYALNDEVYSYAIDISEDPTFQTFFGTFNLFEVGLTYTYTAQGLDPNKFYYFRVYEVRSSGIGSIRIKLKSPSGRVTTIKDFKKGNEGRRLIGTTFTYNMGDPEIDTGKPTFRDSYDMDRTINGSQAPGWTSTSLDILRDSNNDVVANGSWTLYIENSSDINVVKLESWEIRFGYSDELGAQIGNKDAAIDTRLKIVSRFSNANWKTGIWTNGVYEDGLFESGIWYNGIFKGTWG